MLLKKELKEIPPCKIEHLTKAAVNRNKIFFVVSANIVDLKRSGTILVVDYYDTISYKLQVRFFLNKEDKNYISYLPNEDTWKSSSLHNVLYKWFDSNEKIYNFKHFSGELNQCYYDNEHHAMVSNYLQTFSDYFYSYIHWQRFDGITGTIENYCQKIRDMRNLNRQRSKDKRDDFLNSLFDCKYSKDVDVWLDKELLPQYIVYTKYFKDHTRVGRCTHCGKVIKINYPVSRGEKCVCPHCKVEAKYWPMWLIKSRVDKANIMIANEVDGYRTYELATARRHFDVIESSNRIKVLCDYDVRKRTVYDPNKKHYISSAYNTCPYYWGPHWSRYKQWYISNENVYTYPHNLAEVLDKKYAHLRLNEHAAQYNGKLNIITLMNNIDAIPQSEYLIKMGLIAFVADSNYKRYANRYGNSFETITGCNKQYLPLFRDMCVTPDEADIISNSKEFVHPDLLARFRLLRTDTWTNGNILICLKYMTLNKLLNYYEKQKALALTIKEQGGNRSHYDILTDLSDYISMNQQMGVNLNKKNLFPADIYIAHDRTVERYNLIKKDLEEKSSIAALKIVNEFFQGYEKDGLTVLVPHSRQDFIKEGTELSHCVGNDKYYENHIKGKNMIFFIRKSETPNIAYFTCEIDMFDFRVLQLYGYGDCAAPKNIKKFASDFAKWLSKKSIKLQKAG